MTDPTTPVATSSASTLSPTTCPKTTHLPDPTTQSQAPWSPLPSEIEDHFDLMEQHLHAFSITLYRLQQLCPTIKSTPTIRALVHRMDISRNIMRDTVREIHQKMRIPFRISQTEVRDEVTQPSVLDLRPSVQVPEPATETSDSDETPEAEAATTTTASTRFRGSLPREPRSVRRHGPGDLAKTLPYSLDVRDLPSSEYASWRIPYKVVFTPDEKTVDVDGNPLPAIAIDVDENGVLKYAWKNGTLDKEKEKVEYVAEEPCVVEAKKHPRFTTMVRRMTLTPSQRIPPTPADKRQCAPLLDKSAYSREVYTMGGRVMLDFLQSTQSAATAAAGSGKRKRGDGGATDSPGPAKMKRQRTNSTSC